MIPLGDILEDAIIDFEFNTNQGDGASIDFSGGTFSVYKGNSAVQTTAGITVTHNHDGDTGVTKVRIDTSADAYYSVSEDYTLRGSGLTVDTKTVNVGIAHFSIENRSGQPAYDRALLALPASALNDFDPATDLVTLDDGPHGGSSASLTLNNHSDFMNPVMR